jgi:hypothetical protein
VVGVVGREAAFERAERFDLRLGVEFRVECKGCKVEGGWWRVEGGGWRVEGGGWRV